MGIFGRRKKAQVECTDPVCGMAVVQSEGVGPEERDGELYWFCSTECQGQFRERHGSRRARRKAVEA